MPFAPGSYTIKVAKIAGRTSDAEQLASAGKKLTRLQDGLVAIEAGKRLTNASKAAFRNEATTLMSSAITAAKKTAKNVDVHHLIPLEHAHRMGKGFDPNAIQNLAAVDRKIHTLINKEWSKFSKANPNATVKQIMEQVAKIEKEFGSHFFR